MNEVLYINLTPFKNLRGDILMGRKAGEYARMILKLDEVDRWVKDNSNLEVEFQFPNEVYAVNDSFLKGLLQGSYNKLGYDTFVARIKFSSNNENLKLELQNNIKDFIQTMKIINS